MSLIFIGTIREGKLFLDKSEQWKQFLHTFPTGKRVEVTVEKQTHTRTNQQNRYYWKVIVGEIAKHTGHDTDQVHELLKAMFSPKWRFFHPEGNRNEFFSTGVPTSTTRLSTTDFVEYTEKCRIWTNEFLGLQIPLPGELS